jgi:ribose-phosphate pyrophosphokinase
MAYKTLNLVDKEDVLRNLDFKVSKFPDGQQAVTLIERAYNTFDSCEGSEFIIIARLNSFSDLELIVSAVAALREIRVKDINLYVPYFLGARSDRTFRSKPEDTTKTLTSNYLKTVICPIINSLDFKEVIVLDPHSDVLEACIKNFKKVPNDGLINFALDDYFNDGTRDFSKMRLISPDAGALKKVYDVAEHIGYKEDVVVAIKHRDVQTGKITHTEVPITVHDVDKDFFILDDICDGGRTFTEIAKAIKQIRSLSSAVHPDNYGKIYLVVTHGIFSAGLKPLNEHFDGIYSTNSYSDMGDPDFSLKNDNEMHKLKQFKVI